MSGAGDELKLQIDRTIAADGVLRQLAGRAGEGA
jgi:hypothetical protein